MNNPGFVITEQGVVVIDPGSSVQVGRMVMEKVAEITALPVVATISTHIHGDHWLGNQAILERFPDAAAYGHPNLIARAQSGEAETWVDLMLRMTEGATAGTAPAIPDKAIEHGETLKFGDISLTVHHQGLAHTDSDIAVVVKPDNTMFTGDLVFNKRLARMDDGSFIGLVKTLEYLVSLSPDFVVPGHGQTADVAIIQQSLQLYQKVYAVVEENFDSGLADFEIKPIVVGNLKGYSGWSGFRDGIGRLVSLAYLEVEENSF